MLEEFVARGLPHIVLTFGFFRAGNLRAVIRLFRSADLAVFWSVSIALLLLTTLLGTPYVFSLTGAKVFWRKSFQSYVRNLVNGSESRHTRRWSALVRTTFRFLRNAVRKMIFGSVLRHADQVITPSQFMRDFARKNYRVPFGRIQVLPNFTDVAYLPITRGRSEIRGEFQCDGRTFLVGVAARLDSRKRLERLITTMQLLPDSVCAKAVIIGEGENDEIWEWRNRVQKLNVSSRVIFAGSRVDIANYIASFDLCVLPSHHEAFGIVLLEALLLGVPTAVFSDSGGPLEIIENGRTGYVVQSEDELAKLIVKLAAGAPDTADIVCAGRRIAQERFGPDNSDKYVRLFRIMVEET